MNINEDTKQIICYRFDAFCKKVMRNQARTCYRDMKYRRQREISLDYLIDEYSYEPLSLHNGFTIQPMQFIFTEFSINGQVISIENEQLAAALLQLLEKKREIVLLSYFAGMTENEIAKIYGCSRSNISYYKCSTLRLLRQEMRRCEHEEI